MLIKVRACALNISDYQRFQTKKGRIPISTSLTNRLVGYIGKPLGAEISGIVVKTGKNITHVHPGDAVFGETAGLTPAGGLAEYALMDKEDVSKKPENLGFEESAANSISFDAALGVIRKARIRPGQEVMVYGASGGAGLYAVQLAKAAGARVTGVCSTRNIELAKEAGCDRVIDYRRQDFTQSDKKYDVILGINGCNPMRKYKEILDDGGLFVCSGNIHQ
ncbi:MAG: NAD(P)-dependent alcohol dehydrogenase [Eubacterium sp.]